MCGFPTSCLEIQLLALVGLDVMVPYSISQVCGGLDDCPGTETLDGGEDEEGCEGV